MATALTRAQMRENVRFHLQIQTPLEAGVGGAVAGDQPGGQPDPSNNVLNTYLNQAIDAMNRVVRAGVVTTFSTAVAAAAATARRKQWVDISGVLTSPLVTSEIEDIWFVETATGNTYTLESYTYYASKKGYQPAQQHPPGRPAQFIVKGSQIALIPPSNVVGTLYFQAAQGIPPFAADSDQIAVLPVEYQPAIEYYAVLLASARNGQDVEAQSRMQGFAGLAMQTMMQAYQWVNNNDGSAIQSIRDTLMMIPGVERALRAAAAQQQSQSQGQDQ